MKFYRVNPNSDQTRFNHSILIAYELWTPKELKRIKTKKSFIIKHFKPVNVSKFKTFWCFGARFECKL